MASVREGYETLLMVDGYLENNLRAQLPAGATSLDPTPDYAHKEQVLWSEPVQGRDRFYCQDDRARLRWRVTPKGPGPRHTWVRIPVKGGWVLRPKNRMLCIPPMVYMIPENAP